MTELDDLRRELDALRQLVAREAAEASVADQIVESLPFPVQVYAPDGTSQRMNEAQRRFLGLPSKQTGVGVFNIRTDPFAIKNGGAAQFEAAARGEVVGNEFAVDFGTVDPRFASSRGIATFEHFMFPVYDRSGALAAVVSFTRDITHRKQEQDQARVQAERFALALRGSGTGVFSQDRDLRYTWVYDPHPAFAGVDVIGKTDAEIMTPDDAERLTAIKRRVLATGVGAHEQVEIQTGDHRSIFTLKVEPQRDRDGNIIGIMCAASDVTRPVLAERRAHELGQALQQAHKLESLGLLAGGIAHDFNNLLVGVLGNAELALAEIQSNHPAREMLEGIVQAAVRGKGLTHQLLAYLGRAPMKNGTVDVARLVTDMTSLLRPTLPIGVTFSVELAEQLPGVEGDATQLQQVLMNLVINAAEALSTTGGIIRVRAATSQLSSVQQENVPPITPAERRGTARSGTHLLLSVEDSGPGVPTALRTRIFDPFFSTKGVGRGLGLGSAAGLIRRHGGVLLLDDSELGGARFAIHLPASMAPPGQPVQPTEQRYQGRGTVLVVDDAPGVRQVTQHFLESLGFAVITANTGQEAWQILVERPPADLIAVITDVAMPDGDGPWLLAKIRERHPDLLVILCSGLPLAGAAEAGATRFLQKPYRQAELASLLRGWVEGRLS